MARATTRTRTAASKETHLQFALVYFWAAGVIILLALVAAIILNLTSVASTTDEAGGIQSLNGSQQEGTVTDTLGRGTPTLLTLSAATPSSFALGASSANVVAAFAQPQLPGIAIEASSGVQGNLQSAATPYFAGSGTQVQ